MLPNTASPRNFSSHLTRTTQVHQNNPLGLQTKVQQETLDKVSQLIAPLVEIESQIPALNREMTRLQIEKNTPRETLINCLFL